MKYSVAAGARTAEILVREKTWLVIQRTIACAKQELTVAVHKSEWISLRWRANFRTIYLYPCDAWPNDVIVSNVNKVQLAILRFGWSRPKKVRKTAKISVFRRGLEKRFFPPFCFCFVLFSANIVAIMSSLRDYSGFDYSKIDQWNQAQCQC